MKAKKTFTIILFLFSTLLIFSCGLQKYDEDYYYTIEASVDDIDISCYGKGYGKYGQLLERFSNEIENCFNDTGFYVYTTSTDAVSASYNELFLDFIIDRYVTSISADFDILQIAGLSQFKITYTDTSETEVTLTSSYSENVSLTVGKEVSKISIYFKGLKFYPDSYSSLPNKGDISSDDYAQLYKGRKISNKFTIMNVCIE
ncbi:MAG: hypothetical protein K5681_03190 [Treponema sp.]|nr:hypothetical protein [Treponema sp.]